MAFRAAARRCFSLTKSSLLPVPTYVNSIKVVSTRCMCSSVPRMEKVTHTGQQFEDGDWKKVRFIDKNKVVNPNFAQDMIDEVPPVEVTERVISCNGGGGALGHPKVFINVDKPGIHSCGYCGLRFTKKAHH